MIQRDYFMRMIEMLSIFLSKVLFNKEKKNFEDAEKELETAAKTIVGIDLNLFGLLSIDDIVKLMKTSDVYAGRCLIAAELLREYGEVLKLKEKETESENFYLKSLRLYTESLLTKELPEPENYFPKINQLIKKLSHIDLPVELKLNLIDYYEMSGHFSKSEDIIFELIDLQQEGIQNKAISFYKKLKNKSDEELVKGNLSRGEVEEGFNEILSLSKI